MKSVHITLQGKGGVGKSWVSLLLSQYLKAKEPETISLDTDPLSPTLIRYKALNPRHIQIADQVNIRLQEFDQMMSIIAEADSDVVIDTGASTFLPISKYIVDHDIVGMLTKDFDRTVVVHVVINARSRSDLITTTDCLERIVRDYPDEAVIVLWLNEFGGPIKTSDGLPFEKSDFFKGISHRISSIVHIPDPDELTLLDIGMKQSKAMTFSELAASPDFNLMQKSRLMRLRRIIFEQLDIVSREWALTEEESFS